MTLVLPVMAGRLAREERAARAAYQTATWQHDLTDPA